MFEFTKYDSKKRVKGSLVLTLGLGAVAAFYVLLYPSFTEGIDLDEYIKNLPPAIVEAFGLKSLGTIEGFLASELYATMWVILLGLYFAYSASSIIADDVERERMDILLSLPVSRSRIVLEKFLSLLVPIVFLNTIIPVTVYATVTIIGRSLSVMDLVVVHALSIPYLLVCAGIGLVMSVVFDRTSIAQRVSLGLVFGLFLIEAVVSGTDFRWIGGIAPMRYFEPTAILVDGEYDIAGGVILLGATIVLLIASQLWFRRKDIN